MDFKAMRTVLAAAESAHVQVRRDVVYKHAEGEPLLADLYLPAEIPEGMRLPAVIFVHGDGPAELLQDAKDWGQYRSWATLAATAGLAAITFTHRSTERLTRAAEATGDLLDLIGYVREHGSDLQINPDRIGLWVCSAGAPLALPPVIGGQAGPIRCLAALYPLLDIGEGRIPPGLSPDVIRPYSPLAALEGAEGRLCPMLLVRAGLDHPDFTQSADRFAAAALLRNLPLELINYLTGHHAFDLRDDNAESRRILRRVLTFFQEQLAPGV